MLCTKIEELRKPRSRDISTTKSPIGRGRNEIIFAFDQLLDEVRIDDSESLMKPERFQQVEGILLLGGPGWQGLHDFIFGRHHAIKR